MQDALQSVVSGQAVPARSLTKAIYSRLRDDILSARMAPGEKLRVGELRDRYGFSITPVREALMLLAAEGLVRSEEMRGFFVAEASREDLVELTETRCLVEELALVRSISLGDEDWEARAVVAFHRLSRAARPPGGKLFELSSDWMRCHNEFHDSLIAACGLETLIEFCRGLRDRSYRYRRIASHERERKWLSEHEAILTATVNRDSEKAAALLTEHYRRTAEITLRRWDKRAPVKTVRDKR